MLYIWPYAKYHQFKSYIKYMKISVITSMNITKEEKKYCQLFYFLPSLLISVSIGFICKLKEEPASSLQDFSHKKGYMQIS